MPFLKWAGGKSKLIGNLNQMFPKKFNRYFEPFIGGGAVFFYLNPKKAYISDKNKELINVYQTIKEQPDKVIESLKVYRRNLTKAHENGDDESYYYHVRNSERPGAQSEARRAARTIFLNKTCYNGLYRVNSRGIFNVPYGRTAGGNLPKIVNKNNILKCSKALKETEVRNHDYWDVLEKVGKGDFVYLDPPYHAPNKASMYSELGFSDKQQDNVALLFRRLSDKGAYVMLNNSHTLYEIQDVHANIGHLFQCEDYHKDVIDTKWSIGARAEWRKKKGELVVINYRPPQKSLEDFNGI